MSLLNNATLANPGTPYYALATESGKNWYNFPSQTGQVLLLDASGIEVLKSVDGELFYNNELLAKANDIQDIADWSLYPALATVELAGQNITQVNDLSASTIHVSTATISNVVATDVSSATITATGLITAGSINSLGNIQATSITSKGSLDMTNNGITRAASIGISNQGVAPYGSLTSPDGVMLTWNGSEVKTGAAGNVAQWATFPAVQDVGLAAHNLNNVATINASTGNIGTMSLTGNTITGGNAAPLAVASGTGQDLTITSQGSLTESTPNGTINRTAYNSINDNCGTSYNLTVDRFLTPLGAPLNLTAQNGLGGNIQITAKQSATIPGQGSIGYGQIGLTALGSTNPEFGLGGKIDITAYSGGLGEYGGATSRVSVGAATVALSAGAAPALPGLAGSMNIFGNGAVSIVADLVPPILPQIPETVYIFGRGAIRMETGSAFGVDGGVQMLSDTYAGNIYPISDSDLVLQGRSAPDGYVKIMDVNQFETTSGTIAKIDTIQVAAGGTTNPVTIDNLTGNLIAADTTDLTITGKANLIGSDYFVNIAKANSVAFDAAGTGAITGVQSINGAAWPPPTGDASLWSQYKATSVVDISGYNIANVTTINGVAYPPPAESVSNWATYPAIQNVDLSGNNLLNVSTLSSAGRITLTSPDRVLINSGLLDLSGGDIGRVVNILSAPETDINITSTGGINITSGDENINITGGLGITLTDLSGVTIVAPSLDLGGADLNNVKTIQGESGESVTTNSFIDIIMEAANDVLIEAQAGAANLNGSTNVNVNSSLGDVNLISLSEVNVLSCPLNMNNNKITNLAPGTTTTDAVNYNQLTFRDQTEFYVSTQGSDTNNGSILAPKLTIQAAITAAELISSAASICVINVASGHYTETLTFNKGYVVLNGSLQTQTGNEVCEITGSINIACVGANDVFNRQVTFQGFNLSMVGGQTIVNTSSSSHTVAFQDCKVFVDNVFYTSSASAPDMRTYFTNMEITSVSALNTATVISTNVGLVEIERVDLTVNGNAIGLAIGGTSVLNRCSLSTFDNTNTAVILKPLINITSSTTLTHSLGNVAFAFTAATAKTNSSALAIASSINTAIIMLNCVFTLAGTANSTNNCVSYNGVGSPTIAGVNNTSLSVNVLLPQTVTVQSGIAQVSYIDINPPGLACYSSTADQVIAVSGTPQALTYTTTQFNQGTTLLANSRVYANAQGNYALSYSVELLHSGIGVTQTATIFLKKNGTTIANSGRQWSIASGSTQIATMSEFIVALNSGDYVEVFFSGDTSLSANATAAAGALPAIPSVVFNIKQFR